MKLLIDTVILFFTFLVVLYVQDAAANKDDKRAQRRATEIMYESCVDSCRTQCARVPK